MLPLIEGQPIARMFFERSELPMNAAFGEYLD
jgi:hypothetical protein